MLLVIVNVGMVIIVMKGNTIIWTHLSIGDQLAAQASPRRAHAPRNQALRLNLVKVEDIML